MKWTVGILIWQHQSPLFKSQSTFPFHLLRPFLNQFSSFTLQQSVQQTCAGITNSSVEEFNTDMADKSNEGRSTVAVSLGIVVFCYSRSAYRELK